MVFLKSDRYKILNRMIYKYCISKIFDICPIAIGGHDDFFPNEGVAKLMSVGLFLLLYMTPSATSLQISALYEFFPVFFIIPFY